METDHNALVSLIEAVKAGHISTDLIGDTFGDGWTDIHVLAAFDGYLDAAKALHEALLPGWVFDVTNDSAFVCPQEYMTFDDVPDHVRQFLGEDDTPARAWLLAILRAIAAEGETHDQPA